MLNKEMLLTVCQDVLIAIHCASWWCVVKCLTHALSRWTCQCVHQSNAMHIAMPCEIVKMKYIGRHLAWVEHHGTCMPWNCPTCTTLWYLASTCGRRTEGGSDRYVSPSQYRCNMVDKLLRSVASERWSNIYHVSARISGGAYVGV